MRKNLSKITFALNKKTVLIAGSISGKDKLLLNIAEELNKSEISIILTGICNEKYKNEIKLIANKNINDSGVFYTIAKGLDPVAQKKTSDLLLKSIGNVSAVLVIDNEILPSKIINQTSEITRNLNIPFLFITNNKMSDIKTSLTISNSPVGQFPNLVIGNKHFCLINDNKKMLTSSSNNSFDKISALALISILCGYDPSDCLTYIKKSL